MSERPWDDVVAKRPGIPTDNNDLLTENLILSLKLIPTAFDLNLHVRPQVQLSKRNSNHAQTSVVCPQTQKPTAGPVNQRFLSIAR